MNLAVSAPEARLNSVIEFSPSFTTETKAPLGSTAIPAGKLLAVIPVGTLVKPVSAPVFPMENDATVPSPKFVTKRNFPRGSPAA